MKSMMVMGSRKKTTTGVKSQLNHSVKFMSTLANFARAAKGDQDWSDVFSGGFQLMLVCIMLLLDVLF